MDDVEVIQFCGLSQYNQFSWGMVVFADWTKEKNFGFFFSGLTSNTPKGNKNLSFASRSFSNHVYN